MNCVKPGSLFFVFLFFFNSDTCHSSPDYKLAYLLSVFLRNEAGCLFPVPTVSWSRELRCISGRLVAECICSQLGPRALRDNLKNVQNILYANNAI